MGDEDDRRVVTLFSFILRVHCFNLPSLPMLSYTASYQKTLCGNSLNLEPRAAGKVDHFRSMQGSRIECGCAQRSSNMQVSECQQFKITG